MQAPASYTVSLASTFRRSQQDAAERGAAAWPAFDSAGAPPAPLTAATAGSTVPPSSLAGGTTPRLSPGSEGAAGARGSGEAQLPPTAAASAATHPALPSGNGIAHQGPLQGPLAAGLTGDAGTAGFSAAAHPVSGPLAMGAASVAGAAGTAGPYPPPAVAADGDGMSRPPGEPGPRGVLGEPDRSAFAAAYGAGLPIGRTDSASTE